MIQSSRDHSTENIYNRVNSKEARWICPDQIWGVARRKLDQLNAVITLGSLRIPPGNEFEALKGTRTGQHSMRIHDQFRIGFVWMEEGPDRVEITDYH